LFSVQAHGLIEATEVSSMILSLPVSPFPVLLSSSGHHYLPTLFTFARFIPVVFRHYFSATALYYRGYDTTSWPAFRAKPFNLLLNFYPFPCRSGYWPEVQSSSWFSLRWLTPLPAFWLSLPFSYSESGSVRRAWFSSGTWFHLSNRSYFNDFGLSGFAVTS
jgi:hypothetical protein